MGKQPPFETEAKYGVLWQDKTIGADVWLHDGSIVLYQVTHIPDGFVLGGWIGINKKSEPLRDLGRSASKKISVRDDVDPETIEKLIQQNGTGLPKQV